MNSTTKKFLIPILQASWEYIFSGIFAHLLNVLFLVIFLVLPCYLRFVQLVAFVLLLITFWDVTNMNVLVSQAQYKLNASKLTTDLYLWRSINCFQSILIFFFFFFFFWTVYKFACCYSSWLNSSFGNNSK